MKVMSLIAAIRDYFGTKPGQSLGDFMAEVKELNDADRAYFKAGLERIGYVIT